MSLSPNDSTLPNYDDPERIGSPAASLATSIILGTLAVTAVAARLWARLGVLHRAGLDDFFIVIALGFGIGFNVCHEIGIRRNGFGRHIWDIPLTQLESLAYYAFIGVEFYVVGTNLIKLSILLFYRRVLHGSHGKLAIYHRLNYALIFIVLGCLVSLLISMIFTCNPIRALWKQYDIVWAIGNDYVCKNDLPTVLATAYTSLITDILIVVFPLVFIRHIQIRRRERWALRALFLVCTIACIAGAIRTSFITVMLQDPVQDNTTWYGFYAFIWGTIEIYTATICACAPALKPLFTKYFSSSPSSSSPSSGHSSPSSVSTSMKRFLWRTGKSSPSSTTTAATASSPPSSSSYTMEKPWTATSASASVATTSRKGRNVDGELDVELPRINDAFSRMRGPDRKRHRDGGVDDVDDVNGVGASAIGGGVGAGGHDDAFAGAGAERSRASSLWSGVTKRVDVEVRYLPEPAHVAGYRMPGGLV